MSKHNRLLTQFCDSLEALLHQPPRRDDGKFIGEQPINRVSDQDKRSILVMTLKAGDLANVVRPEPIAREWGRRIMEEFFDQGEKEKELHLPVTTFPDRDNPDYKYVKHQLGFLVHVVAPFYSKYMQLIDASARDQVLHHVNGNRTSWEKV
eukprot:scaffold301_cov393-Prasinococcus_capsulatus_cf.AAC.3